MVRSVVASLVLAASFCAPPINQAMKARTDQELAITANHRVDAPPKYEPKPWAEGQWALYKTTSTDGHPSVMRTGIVGREDGGYWLETETWSYSSHSISKALYSKMPTTAEESVDFLQKIVSKSDDGPVQKQDFSANDESARMMKQLMRAVITGAVSAPTTVEGMPREDLAVAAGRFAGCAKFPSRVNFGPVRKKITAWFHPAVPLSGSVKSVADDGSHTTELLDFGDAGAKSALP